jgi:hypothetical protein
MIAVLFIALMVLVLSAGLVMVLASLGLGYVCTKCGKKIYPGEYIPHSLICPNRE